MLAQSASPLQPPCRIGVGTDTSRYGHCAAFLRDDLQPATAELLKAHRVLEHVVGTDGEVNVFEDAGASSMISRSARVPFVTPR